MPDLVPEYVAARRVLLDALDALGGHLDSVVLVGAQAVYLHTGDAELNVPLMTTDADLVLNAQCLADTPEIGQALRGAGFRPGLNPGHWIAMSDVAVDLMVVPHQAGTTKSGARAAQLPPHERSTARIARGLEPALIDHQLVNIRALEPGDPRTFNLRVAGPAALLTAKAIKISERMRQASSTSDRVKEKDALDVFRILQAVETEELLKGFNHHDADAHAKAASDEAIGIYQMHASTAQGAISRLAAQAAYGDPAVAPSMAVLVVELLREIHRDTAT